MSHLRSGESLLVEPAGRSERVRYELAGMRNALRVLRLLDLPEPSRAPVLHGELAWIAVLPENDQKLFAWEFARALESMDATGPEPIEQFLYEWRQTARAWADEDLRGHRPGPGDAER